jgi:hypothetical protein
MDNFSFDIHSEGDHNLELALKLAYHPGRKASSKVVSYRTYKAGEIPNPGTPPLAQPTLVLYHFQTPNDGTTAFPVPLAEDAMLALVKSWLDVQTALNPPDHDGDNEKGWRAFNATGEIRGYTLAAFQPIWAAYGK